MIYLSIDLEATGTHPGTYMTEFAAICMDAKKGTLLDQWSYHTFVSCPSFESLKPSLDPWIIENMEDNIRSAHQKGIPKEQFKKELGQFLDRLITNQVISSPILLFGKSLSALDLPLMTRDLGHEFMRKYFSHQTLDLTCLAHALADKGTLPEKCRKGSELMKHLKMGDVCHTAMEDARNTALMYFELMKIL